MRRPPAFSSPTPSAAACFASRFSSSVVPTLCAAGLLAVAAAAGPFAPAALAIDLGDTRMLADPAVSADRIAFVYDDDLWLAGRDGGEARRLTHAAGRESDPYFSPDGAWLAFSAPYDGNTDVYVMPAGGGEARRLTWHPRADYVRGFTPDGQAVLFESARSVYTSRHTQVFRVPVAGGPPERLPVPSAFQAALSPDGKLLAYNPARPAFEQWKNYRGGTASRLWLVDLGDLSVVEVPKPAGGANDTDPVWIGNTLYFRSDRDGEFNLYRFDRGTGAAGTVTRLTSLGDFPVTGPTAAADGALVFEHGGYLHQLDTTTGATRRLSFSAPSDLLATRPRTASGGKWLRGFDPAPDAKRVVVELRGEIVSLPAEKGDPRVLFPHPGANDRSPVWSPDGKQVAWLSDREGDEYALFLGNQDGSGTPRRIPLAGAGFYTAPQFSPDGKRLALRDNSQSLWVVELASGKATKVASEPIYSPLDLMTMSWAPDSQWLAYSLKEHGLTSTVWIWSAASGKSERVGDGLSELYEPVFDPKGEFLYVLASTDAGPAKDWFAQSSSDMGLRSAVYAVTLRRDGPHPLPPESDEVGAEDKAKDDAKDGKAGAAAGKSGKDVKAEKAAKDDQDGKDAKTGDGAAKEPPAPVVIDFAGLGDRIVALPITPGTLRNLRVGASGEIYVLRTEGRLSFDVWGGSAELDRFTLAKRETKTIAKKVDAFELSRDGKSISYLVGEDLFVTAVGDELAAGKGKLALDRAQVRVEPRAEWAQIFGEAWRINRDYFYAPNYHGADWPAMRTKYAAFLPHLATRGDLDRVIEGMLSELAVGHSYLGAGDDPFEPEKVPVGLLGADFRVDSGRWQFAKVLGGLNWNPDLRAPLRTPGAEVAAGEYLLAVDGRDLTATSDVFAAFEHTVGRQVRLTVGPTADGKGARDVVVVPVADERNLRYLDWVEANVRKTDERSQGRVAYVHVPDTGGRGHEMFKRYFYPQSHKQAIVVDERHNGGGQVADYYIDILRRPYVASWQLRYGGTLVTPRGAVFGPKVMIADEGAGSGGDLLPWMFQQAKLGPVVGKRTWGGLVGILGFPGLMDGGQVTSPNLAFWTPEEGYGIENVGVAPDVEVEQWPRDVEAGRDPQLERAIDLALEALAKNPPPVRTPPPFPVRVWTGAAGNSGG